MRISSNVVIALALLTAAAIPSAAVAQPILELGPELVASEPGTGRPVAPVAQFADASFVVVWERPSRGIAGRQYSPEGVAFGAEVLLVADDPLPPLPFSAILTQHREPALVAHPDGSFLVIWVQEEVAFDAQPFWQRRVVLGSAIVAQRFDPLGLPLGGRQLVGLETPGLESAPVATPVDKGEVMVVWKRAGEDEGVLARRVDADGVARTRPSQVAAEGSRFALAALEDGTALVVWDRCCDAAGRRGLDASLIASVGTTATRGELEDLHFGPSFAVSSGPVGIQVPPSVAATDSTFLVAWQGARAEGPVNPRIRGRLISAIGVFVGDELVLSNGLGTAHSSPAVAALPEGPFLVSWMVWNRGFRSSLWGSLVDLDGVVGEPVRITDTPLAGQWATSLQSGRRGDFLAAWLGYGPDDRIAVRARVVHLGTPATLFTTRPGFGPG